MQLGQDSSSEVLIAQELRLKVQVATSTSLYTARRLRASKGRERRGHSPKRTVPPLCGPMYRTR